MTKRETYISRQARRLSTGQIDRRRFVMSALASGVTMPTAMSLASRAEGSVPKRGGHLVFGVSSAAALTAQINRARGSTLVAVGDNNQLVGDLAEQVEGSPDGAIWDFALRGDVTFHSGKPLDVSDVIASLESVPSSLSGVTDLIDRIETHRHRLRVHLKAPHPGFDRLMADPSLIILPAKDGRVQPDSHDGTGLYQLGNPRFGNRVRLIRNPNHWRQDRGHFASVDLIPLPDARLRQSAIMTGEVDAIDAVDPRALAMLASLPGLKIAETEGDQHLALDLHIPNAHIRSALRFALDRHALLERGVLGHGALGDDTPDRRALGGTLFDPDRARHHLLSTGARGLVQLGVNTEGAEGSFDLLALLDAPAQAAGFDLRPVAPGDPADVYAKRLRAQEIAGQPLGENRRLIPLWTNDLVAYSEKLTPDPKASRDSDVVTRWWVG